MSALGRKQSFCTLDSKTSNLCLLSAKSGNSIFERG